MSFLDRFKNNSHDEAYDLPEEVEVERLDVRRIKSHDTRPLHEQYLSDMEAKRNELLRKDAEVTEEINQKHRELASIRMALGGVETMMASIKKHPITPPVIQSVSEFREREKAKTAAAQASQAPSSTFVQMQSRLHRQGQQHETHEVKISEDGLLEALKADLEKPSTETADYEEARKAV